MHAASRHPADPEVRESHGIRSVPGAPMLPPPRAGASSGPPIQVVVQRGVPPARLIPADSNLQSYSIGLRRGVRPWPRANRARLIVREMRMGQTTIGYCHLRLRASVALRLHAAAVSAASESARDETIATQQPRTCTASRSARSAASRSRRARGERPRAGR